MNDVFAYEEDDEYDASEDDAFEEIEVLAKTVLAWVRKKEEWRTMAPPDLAKDLKALGELKKAMKIHMTTINILFDELRIKIVPESLENIGVTSMNISGVGRLGLTADVYASIIPDHKQGAYDWLSDNGLGDIIKPTVNASTLKSVMKSRLKKGEDIPEELFRVTPYSRASITKV